MSYWSQGKLLVSAVHVLLFLVGLLGVEIFLRVRRKWSLLGHSTGRAATYQDDIIVEDIASQIEEHDLLSRRKIGAFAFGLSFLACFGFVLIICTKVLLSDNSDRSFLDLLWAADVIICKIIIFYLAPAGLCHKYINITSELRAVHRISRVLLFLLVWNCISWAFTRAMLSELLVLKTQADTSTVILDALGVSGFGLAFIAVLTGFTSVYVPYRVYVTRKDVLTTTQVDNRIADATMAIQHLREEILKQRDPLASLVAECSEEESEDEEFEAEPTGFFRTSHYMDRMEQNSSPAISTAPEAQDATSDPSCATYAPEEAQAPGAPTGVCRSVLRRVNGYLTNVVRNPWRWWRHTDLAVREATNQNSVHGLMRLQAYIRQERAYLLDIRHHRQLWNSKFGRLRIMVRYCEVLWAVRTVLVVSYRIIKISQAPYAETATREGATKVMAHVYHLYIKDNFVRRLISDVLMRSEPPSYLDLTLSRISALLLMIITLANLDHFFDFCRILLNTQYFQKRRLLTDNSLGLALSAFLVCSVPSQFCLMIPFLPESQRKSALQFMFEGDILVWLGLQHRFDLFVFVTIMFMLIGVAIMHHRRPKYYALRDRIVCNV
ncbi:membrane protein, putative [Babesia bigemina]|uniref:Membrane protein, putative n=1 Tax=Babesia bigemina TaxID=5866 RepID=A0A061DB27_BABBI|nr:membrane protein, putative [Babesia bigemina]CDR94930.1 membrane protein, putative [Babesia bigemina]|eukprot:XP_012767116.1 membrane protein, putative [Babesia bigemina]